MQAASFRIWTWVTNSISTDDHHYTKYTHNNKYEGKLCFMAENLLYPTVLLCSPYL